MPQQEATAAPTVELPSVDAAPAEVDLGWNPPFSLDTAPFAPGSGQAWKAGADSIIGAITWLAGIVREERAARMKAETRAAEVATMAQRALEASSGSSASGGGGAVSAGEVQKKLDLAEQRWRQREARDRAQEEVNEAWHDALQREVHSRALGQDLEELRQEMATQASQIRQQVGRETRQALQEGVAKEAEALRERFVQISQALNVRIDLLDQRLEDMNVSAPPLVMKEPVAAAPAVQAKEQPKEQEKSSKKSEGKEEQKKEAPKESKEAAQSTTVIAGLSDEALAKIKELETRIQELESRPSATTSSAPAAAPATPAAPSAPTASVPTAAPTSVAAAAATSVAATPPAAAADAVPAAAPAAKPDAAPATPATAPAATTSTPSPAAAVPAEPQTSGQVIANFDYAAFRDEIMAAVDLRFQELKAGITGAPAADAAPPIAAPAAVAPAASAPAAAPSAATTTAAQPAAQTQAPSAPASTPAAAQAPAAAVPAPVTQSAVAVAAPGSSSDEIKAAVDALRMELRGYVDGELKSIRLASAAQAMEPPPPMPVMPAGGDADDAMASFKTWVESTIQHFRVELKQEVQQGLDEAARRQSDTKVMPMPMVEESRELEMPITTESLANVGLADDVSALASRLAEMEKGQINPEKINRMDGRVAMLERAVNGPAKDIAALQERVGKIERGDKAASNAESNALLEIQDEVRRLKFRFEYLERIVPPDVQRAMQFFEPLKDEEAEQMTSSPLNSPHRITEDTDNMSSSGGMGGNGSVLKRLNLLQVQQDQTIDAARSLAEDGRREVSNLSLALRGVQRDSEIGAARIDGIRSDVSQLQARIEAALPQVMKALEQVLGQKVEVADKDLAGPVAEIEELQKVMAESTSDAARRFVSQETLRKALEAVQADMQAWLEKLRQDILAAMVGKADNAALRSLSEQLDKQAETPMRRTLAQLPPPSATDEAAFTRWPLIRCVSCDKKVNMQSAGAGDPWPSRGAMPLPPSFPAGRSNNVALRPLRREASTPTVPGVLSGQSA